MLMSLILKDTNFWYLSKGLTRVCL